MEAVAIVGVGAILPDAPDAAAFWDNITSGRYSISEVAPNRWDPELYYDPDPKAPDKTYSKIGGWVRDWSWDPMGWRMPIPPRVAESMDDAQKWAVAVTRAVLEDYGKPIDGERTAVILGNAMGGEKHYATNLRISYPEIARSLGGTPSFQSLPGDVQASVADELLARMSLDYPEITEDTMPGELGNVMAGRVANLFDFHGPNFIVDAACASAMAAIDASIEGLIEHEFDSVITGGVDRNMGASSYVKFCKIGALSATGTRPFDAGADGFVMGEGAALFLLKRLSDAERDGDRVYAVLRGIAGASDGRGKGITAPNPAGQRYAMERAWRSSGVSPAECTLVEAHGTSTRVGDVVEVGSLSDAFADADLLPGTVALGSVKSNIGHLKAAAGAAGILKTVLALHHKVLPPSLNFRDPNPNVDWATSPFRVNTELREWEVGKGGARVAGVSAFGFGGTNFHTVIEEHVPGRVRADEPKQFAVGADLRAAALPAAAKAPLRGALVIGAPSERELVARVQAFQTEAAAGKAPPVAPPRDADLHQPERLAVDYADAVELADKLTRALAAFEKPASWKLLQAKGVHRGSGPAPKVAFLYTGQGSQYVNMLQGLRGLEPVVAEAFVQADAVMTPLLGRPLTDYIFVDGDDPAAVESAEEDLRNTEITQPAVLATDLAITRLLGAYGVEPDMVIGHSLGEYGALVAAGALSFEGALEAVSARGREMAHLSVDDNGAMAAVFAPLDEVQRVVDEADGYVVLANVNSNAQAVIGGATAAVHAAVETCQAKGFTTALLPVSHAFHTSIVAPASAPLRVALERLQLHPPALPIVSNVTGEFYPMGAGVTDEMLDLLARQVASPVQFVAGLQTLYQAGARVFVEVGPKRALHGFALDVLGHDPSVVTLSTNHPKLADEVAFNQALCGLYAAGLGAGVADAAAAPVPAAPVAGALAVPTPPAPTAVSAAQGSDRMYTELGRLFADFIDKSRHLFDGNGQAASGEPVVLTGAALGLPGTEHVFDDENVARILRGEQFIDVIPTRIRAEMLDKHITRLVKGDGGGRFETIEAASEVIKLAGRGGAFDLGEEFGVEAERLPALGKTTRLAIGAGIDALRDAGIPLVMRYKTSSIGTQLPDGWGLPDALRDDTGVIFASAFPGLEEMTDEVTRHAEDTARRAELAELSAIRGRVAAADASSPALAEIDRRLHDVQRALDQHPYTFDRRFLFRVLSMGHSQFAEMIGARGPNTQINAACASTTQAIALAEDWIRAGRCRRVVVVAADDATSDHMLGWIGAGFLASGAAATDEDVAQAALPFDRRRHGMLLGMGAAALVVESAPAARERGLQPICEVIGSVTANSAFHGTRLNVDHIGDVMETVVGQAERRGIDRHRIAGEMVFVSHETYTPARGGSAAAEIYALRRVFGPDADKVVIANTKGFTGHPMGVGIEDVVAVKALETGIVPPVPNFREVDPELGNLNLSTGGAYPVRYALRLAAGFGSQIAMVMLAWTPVPDGRHRAPDEVGFGYRVVDPQAWQRWLSAISGHEHAALEVVQRRLRVVDAGPGARPAVPAPAVAVAVAPVAAAPAAPAPASPSAPPMPPPAPVAPAATPPAVPVSVDEVAEKVLALVAEQTGYPPDMLDLDLDLEADLGVDTVKQAELFATVRETYGIERDDSLRLRDYPTLNHVIGFVRDRSPQAAAAPGAAPAAAPAAAAPSAAPAAAVPVSVDEVAEKVLALVAEQTGYPPDMLDLDLDLEADLGVDTVKQAELFATVRETYGIERDDSLRLRDYPTLNHVIGFVRDRSPQAAAAPGAAPAAAAPSAAPAAAVPVSVDEVAEKVLALVAEQTGYPPDMLDLDLDLEADLGVDTVKQAELFATVRETYGIERDDSLRLRDYPTLNHVIGFVRDRSPQAAAAQAAASEASTGEVVTSGAEADAGSAYPRRVPVAVVRPSTEMCLPTGVELGAGRRVVVMADTGGVAPAVVAALESLGVETLVVEGEPAVDELEVTLGQWREGEAVAGVLWLPGLDATGAIEELDEASWKPAVHRRVKLAAATARALYDDLGAGAFFVSGTRLGGKFGYDDSGARDVIGGAVSGFTKALARERADATVKVVDFTLDANPADVAAILLDEVARDPGVVEVGRTGDLRWSVGLATEPAEADPARALGADAVFVVTGAAGSIVSAITADLARASGGTFHLLDLTPEPDRDDSDLARFAADRDALKLDLAARITERGERATPALVERELARIERSRAALDAIEAVEAAGGTAHWYQVDLTDGAAVTDAVARVVERSGRVDVLAHCAGLEISRFLPDKTQREYDLVFDVKVDGWFHLLRALGDVELGAAVVFSSIAGRFGNGGQTDYSAANDLLCKSISGFKSTRPQTRGIAIDWTAWAGIGMAARGSIPKMMALAGIDMLPPGVGIPAVRGEIEAFGGGGEVVIAGRLGLMLDERHPSGGLDPAAVSTAGGPVAGRAVRATLTEGLVVEVDLDVSQPFLDDHRIEGTPVLPGVMGVEAFCEVASVLAGGRHVIAVEDVDFLAPFKLYRDEPRVAEVRARLRSGEGDTIVADCSLVGRRVLANHDAQETVHFTGRVVLSPEPARPDSAPTPSPSHDEVAADDIYRIYFHGPTYQVLEAAWRDGDTVVGRLAADLPANHLPSELPLVAAPRLVELCFQTAGVHELGTSGRMGLPTRVERIELHGEPGEGTPPVYAMVEPDDGASDAVVVDASGRVLVRLVGYRTAALPAGPDGERLAPLAAAMA